MKLSLLSTAFSISFILVTLSRAKGSDVDWDLNDLSAGMANAMQDAWKDVLTHASLSDLLPRQSKYANMQALGFNIYTGPAEAGDYECDDNEDNCVGTEGECAGKPVETMGDDDDDDMYCYLGLEDIEEDIEKRMEIMTDAVEKAYEYSDTSNDTLKVFLAPEFFWRGPRGGYEVEHENGWRFFGWKNDNDFHAIEGITDSLEKLVKNDKYEDWLFVFGTIVGVDSVENQDCPKSSKNTVCTLEYAPVECDGCRYSNQCVATGASPEYTSDTCTAYDPTAVEDLDCPKPSTGYACPRLYAPVYCGECSYSNQCIATSANPEYTSDTCFGYDPRAVQDPPHYLNIAPIYKGGEHVSKFIADKEYVSWMDFLGERSNIEDMVGDPYIDDKDTFYNDIFDYNYLAENGFTWVKHNWFEVDNITMTLEICLDHFEWQAKANNFHDQYAQVSLIVSAGAHIESAALRPTLEPNSRIVGHVLQDKGLAFLQDGLKQSTDSNFRRWYEDDGKAQLDEAWEPMYFVDVYGDEDEAAEAFEGLYSLKSEDSFYPSIVYSGTVFLPRPPLHFPQPGIEGPDIGPDKVRPICELYPQLCTQPFWPMVSSSSISGSVIGIGASFVIVFAGFAFRKRCIQSKSRPSSSAESNIEESDVEFQRMA